MVECSSELDLLFYSLADETRRDMLQRLMNTREMTIKELASQYNFSFAGVAKHVSVLQKAQLVTKRKEGRTQVVSINPLTLKSLDDYVRQYQKLWNDRFDRLDNILKEM